MRTHGIRRTYQAGCRCDECCAAAADGLRRERRMKRDGWGPPVPIDPHRRFTPPPGDEAWRDQAACREHRDLFWLLVDIDADRRSAQRRTQPLYVAMTAQGRKVCRTCPVAAECDAYAMQAKPYGMWAGRMAHERRADNVAALRRELAELRRQAQHREAAS